MIYFNVFSLILATIVTLMQFRREDKVIRKSALLICSIACAISVFETISSYEDQKEISALLKKSDSRISWKDSSLSLSVMNGKTTIAPEKAQIIFKIIPKNSVAVDKVGFGKVMNSAHDTGYGYKQLSERRAEDLFFSLAEKNRSISRDKEKEAGVGTLSYSGDTFLESDRFGSTIQLSLDYEPDVSMPYRSMYDLKDKFVIARIVTGTNGKARVSAGLLKLKTERGPSNLIFSPINIKDGKLVTESVRYVGLFLDEDLFKI